MYISVNKLIFKINEDNGIGRAGRLQFAGGILGFKAIIENPLEEKYTFTQD